MEGEPEGAIRWETRVLESSNKDAVDDTNMILKLWSNNAAFLGN
jgi:hypothetical protein